MVIGSLVYAAGFILSIQLLITSLESLYICPFIVLGPPLLYLAAVLTDRKTQGKVNDAVWWIVFILLLAVTGYSVYMGVVLWLPRS